MNRLTKRVISSALSLAMVLSMLPARAFETPEGLLSDEESVIEEAGTLPAGEDAAEETGVPSAGDGGTEETDSLSAGDGGTEPFSDEAGFTYEALDDTGCAVTGYTGSETELVIPSQADGYAVRRIAADAFKNRADLTGVEIPAGVTRIESAAFYNCTGLKSVALPEGLEYIGVNAFRQCSALTGIRFPSTVTHIGTNAFTYCTSLSSAHFYGDAPTMDFDNTYRDYAFYKCASNFRVFYIEGRENWTTPTWRGYSAEHFVPASEGGQVEYAVEGGSVSFDPGTGQIVKYSGNPSSVTIPARIESVAVTGIAARVFSGCQTLNAVVLPEGLRAVGSNAFYNCPALASVSLPGTLEEVGDGVFENCTALRDVTLGEDLKVLGKRMFYGCSLLGSLSLPDGITEIPESCFYKCSVLTLPSLPSNLTEIKSNAFYYCEKLADIALPEGLETLGYSVFYGCVSLTEVAIPSGVTSLNSYAFYRCTGLKSAVLPEGLTYLGGYAFSYSGLEEIELPGSIKSIDTGVFSYCSKLKKAILPEGMTRAGTEMFRGCTSLTSIHVPRSLTGFGNMAFQGCTALTSAYFYSDAISITSSDSYYSPFSSCAPNFKIYYMEGTKGWTTPVWNGFDAEPFVPTDGKELVEYAVEGGGVRFDPSTGLIVDYTGSPTAINIPAEIGGAAVTGVAPEAFSRCGTLKSAVLPEGLKTLGSSAFFGCAALETVDLPDSLEKIGTDVFQDCAALKSAALPDGLREIGKRTFYGCASLTEVKLPAEITEIPARCFYNCKALASLALPENLTAIGAYAFCGCVGLAAIALPESLETLGEYAFRECKALKKIEIPSGVESLEKYAFYGCTALAEAKLPEGMTGIGECAFYGCTALAEVKLPDSLTSIGPSAFYNDAALEEIEIPSGVTVLLPNVFRECKKLKTLILPEGLEAINDYAFWDCSSLTSVRIPSTVESIGYNVFYNCKALSSAYFYGPPCINSGNTSVFNSCASNFKIYFVEGTEGWTAPTWNGYNTEPFIPVSEEDLVEYAVEGGSVWFDPETGLIMKYTGSPTAVDIPGEIEGRAVTGVMSGVFSDCGTLKSAALPEGLKTIGSSAFYNCAALESVSLPGTLEAVGDDAFRNCGQLKRAELAEGIAVLGNQMFCGCAALEAISLPAGIEEIPKECFSGCKSLSAAVLPEGLKVVGASAFKSCEKLPAVRLPDSLTEIGTMAFQSAGLEEIEVPSGVKRLEMSTFRYCSKLKKIVLSEGLESIGPYILQDNKALSGIDIPSTVRTIENYAFTSCAVLASAHFYGDAPGVDANPFSSCPSNFKIYYVEGKAGWTTPTWNGYKTDPFIPVQEDGLVEYAVEGGSVWFDPETGLIVKYTGSPAAIDIPGKIGDAAVTGVAAEVFSGCGTLKSAALPEGLRTIGGSAFSGCAALETVNLPGTLETVGADAFRDCGRLAEASMADGLKVLGRNMFFGCSSLGGVSLPAGISEIPEYCFFNCTKLNSVTLPEGLTAIGGYAFSGCAGLANAALPGKLKTLGERAFENCRALEGIEIPSGVTALGDYVFYNCSALKEAGLPDGMTSIGSGAFSGCSALKKIRLPDSLTDLGSSAFERSGLTEIEIPSGVKTIAASTFLSCGKLARVTLPEGLERLNDGSFSYCSALTSVRIPSTVTEINGTAFRSCPALAAAYFSGGAPAMGAAGYYYTSGFYSCASNFKIYYAGGTAKWTEPEWNGYSTAKMTLYNGSYYEAVGSAMTWEEARAFAEARGGQLAAVTDAEEEAYAGALAAEAGLSTFWLGGRKNDAGAWEWLTGEDWDYHALSGESEGEGAYLYLESAGDALAWKAGGGGEARGFLLEVDMTPEEKPPSTAEVTYAVEGGSVTVSTETGTITGYSGEPAVLHIPAKVRQIEIVGIDAAAFNDCASLKTITVDADNANFTVKDGLLYGGGGTTVLLCPKARTGAVTLAEGTAAVGSCAFYRCAGVTEVIFPESVRTISDSAFRYCGSLESVSIPEGCGSLGTYAFAYCGSLKTLSLPEGFAEIPEAAFFYCTSLSTVTLPESLRSIGSFAFRYCGGLTGVYFRGDAPSVGSNVFADAEEAVLYYRHGRYGWTTPLWNGYQTREYEGDPDSGYYAVDGGTLLFSVKTGTVTGYSGSPVLAAIPSEIDGTAVTGIAAGAFSGCAGLTEVYLPDTLTELGDGIFEGCSASLRLYGAKGSAGEAYASENGLTFVPCGVASVMPAQASTIGGESYNISVTMTSVMSLPLYITAENGEGDVIPVSAVDSMRVTGEKTVHTFALDLSEFTSGMYRLRFARPEYGVDVQREYYVDRTAPGRPQDFTVTPGSACNILVWAPPAEADISYILIYKGTGLEEEPKLLKQIPGKTTTSYTDTDVENGAEYVYWVSFMDGFSQESQWAGPVSGVPEADDELPVITYVRPLNGSCLTGTVTFHVAAEDNSGVKSIAMETSVDGGETWETLRTILTGGSASFELNSLEYGVPELKVRFHMSDVNGNTAYSEAVYSYPIDNEPPERVTGVWGEASATTVTLHWNKVAADDFSHFVVERRNSDGTYTEVSQVKETLGVNITGLTPDASYTYRVAACDIHGNLGAYSEEVTVVTQTDGSAPVITAMSPGSAPYHGEIPLRFTVYDDHGIRTLTVQISYDGKEWEDVETVQVSETRQETAVEYALDTTACREGLLYVRGIAEDVSGNTSDASDGAPFVQYMIDRTAPAAPEGLNASAVSGTVYLTWTQGPEEDLNGYNVYRSTEEDGDYELLREGLEKVSYTDAGVTVGQTYYYKLSCRDTAGNVSAFCAPVGVTVEAVPDTEPPKIISVSPSDGYMLGLNTPIKVKVYDDQLVAELRGQYSADGASWTDLEAAAVNESAGVVTLPLTAAGTEGETLYLRVYCVDGAGRSSEAVSRTYRVDRETPAPPVLGAVPSPMSVTLTWTSGNEADLAGFYIYRRADGESEYTYLAQCSNTGAAEYSYTDGKASVGTGYSYCVSAVDARGNTAGSEPTERVVPLNEDIVPPVVRASGNTVGTTGVEMSFSAAGSTDNVGIVSYLWDFGDGASSNQLQPNHAYSAAGSYTVTLTVADAAGNSTSGQISVTVKDAGQVGVLDVAIIDENGLPVSNAGVYFNLGDDQQSIVYTNGSGKARITAGSGSYDVGAYKSGYLPAKTKVTLLNGGTKSIKLTLVRGDVVTGELTVERMTLSEIEAAEIDVANPANQEVFRYEITLTYGNDTIHINRVQNGGGDVLMDPKPVEIEGGSNGPRVLHPFVFSSGPLRADSSAGQREEDVPIIVILDLPGEAAWLRDFFDVHLYVLNQANKTFVLEDCAATLNIPEGLTLVESNRTDTSATVSLGSIAGQTSATAEWILRGDQAGEYTLSADFSGVLREFNERVTAAFEAAEPLRVRSGDSLFMDVMVESAIAEYADGAIRVGLRNEDTDPYYLPAIQLEKAEFVSSFKTSGLVYVDTDKKVLLPGEEIWFDYVVGREDWAELMENQDSDFYLQNQISRMLDGTELQVTYTEMAPFTIAGGRIKVYQLDPNGGEPSEIQYVDLTKTNQEKATIPDLLIETYRLNEEQVYEPCAMTLTIQDTCQGKVTKAATGGGGTYVLSGYEIDLSELSDFETYTLTIGGSRARPVEIPIVIRGKTAAAGYLEVYTAVMKDGSAVPVSGASVTAAGRTLLTDESGYALFKGVDQGYQTVEIRGEGYLPLTRLVEVSEGTEETFFLTVDSDPGASRVTSVESTLLDASGSGDTVIPYGAASGTAQFTLGRRIAEGESFRNYRYRIEDGGRGVVEENTFPSDTFMLDITKLKPGYTLSFAVDTDAGTSAYTSAGIRAVETPPVIMSLLGGPMNITSSWKSKPSKLVDLTGIDGQTLDVLEAFQSAALLEQFSYSSSSGDINALIDLVRGYRYETREGGKLFPLIVSYEPNGTFTVSFIYGDKESVTSQSGPGYWSGSMFTLSNAAGSQPVRASLALDMVFSYDGDAWKLRVAGTEKVDGTLTYRELPSSSIPVSAEFQFSEDGTWNLPEADAGAADVAALTELLNKALESLEVSGSLKAAVGANIVSKRIASSAGYVKGGVKAVFDEYWKVLLTAEIGHEETMLLWKNTGKMNVSSGGGAARSRMRAASLTAPDENELTIAGISAAEWAENPAGSGVIADGIYSGCDPQTAALPDGRTLMVFIDTDSSRDSSNPTVLQYSILSGGRWSAPQAVSNDGTIDLYPALTVTDEGAAVVWIDLGSRLSNAEKMTASAIRGSVYTQMNVSLSCFDAKTSTWSEPVRVAEPGALSHHPAVGYGDGRIVAAWVQNENGASDRIACAAVEDGRVVSTAAAGADGSVEELEVLYQNGAFAVVYKSETAGLRALALEGSSLGAPSKVQSEAASVRAASNGNLYYVAGSRLYEKRGSVTAELAAGGLLTGAEELNAAEINGKTYLSWSQTDGTVSRICACYVDQSASDPVVLAESDTLAYGIPAITSAGGKLIAVYLSREYDPEAEDYNAGYKLNQLELAAGYDVRVDQAEGQLLYPGATVTTYYQCSNEALLSETAVTVSVAYGPDGSRTVASSANQKLSGAIVWTVPKDYNGENLYLVVECASGRDFDPTDNYAPAGTPFVDVGVSNAKYMGTRDGEAVLKLTLENSGLAAASSIVITVTDAATGKTLYNEDVGSLSGNAKRDYKISAALDCDYVRISAKPGNGDILQTNNDSALYLNSANFTAPTEPTPPEAEEALEFGQCRFSNANGTVGFTRSVKNNGGSGIGAEVFLSVYDGNGKFLRTVRTSVTLESGENQIGSSISLTSSERSTADHVSVVVLDKNGFAPLCGKAVYPISG